MAAMSTVLNGKSISGSTITYTLPSHTAADQRLLIQTSNPADGKKRTSQDAIRFVFTAKDAEGLTLPERDSFEVIIKRAAYATGANWSAGLKAEIIDILSSDEFWTNVRTNSMPLKPILG